MGDLELSKRIEELRLDFAAECGKPFEHFFCPMLMRDEPAEMCRAHIVNEALGACDDWVPQRKDVDNFFGSAVEADLVTIIRNKGKKLTDILRDTKVKGKIKPKLLDNETVIGHYFPKPGAPSVGGHTVAKLIDNGQSICNLAIKKAENDLLSLTDSDLAFVIDADFQPEVTASMIKAAHLTLFKLFGYKHVFSVTGCYLASILRDFFEKYKPPAKCQETHVADYFCRFESMVVPILKAERLKGTATDNRLLSVFGSSGNIYAMGVIVNAGEDTFCVFVPGMESAIDTYFSFLEERPKSIAVKVTQLFQATASEETHFGIPPGEPTRLFFAAEEPRREIRCEPPFVLDSSAPANDLP
jgi:hypothetical protein